VLSGSSEGRIVRAGVASVAVGLLVLALKLAAAWTTGSIALLSDGLESIVNVVAAAIALFAVKVASRPADHNHPFGHSKIEYFSAGIEGALVVLAALTILVTAVRRFGATPSLPALGVGLGLSAVYLLRVGRRHHSPAIVADGQHVQSDVLTSLAVLGGFAIAWATGFWALDALIAVGVAGYILGVGIATVRRSFGGLMDEGLEPAEVKRIERLLAEHRGDALEVHDLRTRRAGRDVFVDFHLVTRGSMTVAAAHDLCDRLEERLGEAIPGAQVSIHVEPEREAHGLR
jgi:cation diffusion facilitator family transporter